MNGSGVVGRSHLDRKVPGLPGPACLTRSAPPDLARVITSSDTLPFTSNNRYLIDAGIYPLLAEIAVTNADDPNHAKLQ